MVVLIYWIISNIIFYFVVTITNSLLLAVTLILINTIVCFFLSVYVNVIGEWVASLAAKMQSKISSLRG